MKRNWSDYIVAFAVLACSVVLLGALTYALSGWRAEKDARTLHIDYADVTGIRVHSEVRYAGAPAGTVTAVRHLTSEERAGAEGEQKKNAVRVSVALRKELPPLPSDVKSTLASDTLLSEKFIALSAGTPEAVKLADGALLQGQSGGSLDDLISSAGPILATVDTTLRSIEPVVKKTGDTLDTLKSGIQDVMPRINTVADSAKSAANSADELLQRAEKLISDNEGAIKEDLLELKNALVQLQGVLKTTNGFVGSTDRQLAARMQELAVVLQNLKVVTTQAKGITQTLGEKPSRLIWGSRRNKLPSEETILRAKRPVPLR
jgi:ABC-type transporter Mla subunit MlaD